MMKTRNLRHVAILLLALLVLAGCGKAKPELPEPQALASALLEAAGGPEMSVMPADFLLENTGLKPEDYVSAVYYLPESSTAPDELIVVRCADGEAAEAVKQRLEKHLARKEEAAKSYLTEQLPVIRGGSVRRDGFTVTLAVFENMEAVREVFQRYR
jgi:hypothetical protein